MTPPQASDKRDTASTSVDPAAVSHLQRLRNRPDFLRAASARRCGTAGFLLQARARQDGTAECRVGFTASKKIGNAVLRNRAKRRLRAVAAEALAPLAQAGWDYVLVARPEATVSRDFTDLLADLRHAVAQVHVKTRPA